MLYKHSDYGGKRRKGQASPTNLSRARLWREFVKEGEIIEKGFITLPDRPGFGVEMNEEAARKVQMPDTPWFTA